MSEKFYITTPAYYPNNVAHLGHAYTTIAVDVIARWKRLEGKDVMFISGMDEHGSKIENAAKENRMKPQDFVDKIAKNFLDTWATLNISLDGFIRTSEKRHIDAVIDVFNRINKNGDIYKGVYEDWYCIPCESFLTESQLIDGECPECSRKVEKLKEESYFFRLSKYQEKLLELYEKNPDFISPKQKRQEIINRVKEGLRDLSISRTKVKWGIPVPIDKKSTLYVWVDALTFYLSVLGYPRGKLYKEFWPANVHVMAKEILWFHSVILPALLMSAKIALPKKVFAHGWLTVEGQKMSKSLGNFIIPEDIVNEYGVDQFRYFLMRHIPFGEDGNFSEEALKARVNGELLSDLGNLVSRVLTLTDKYLSGKKELVLSGKPELERFLNFKKIQKSMDDFELHHALDGIWDFIRAVNRYINQKEPWKLEGKVLEGVLYNLLESLRIVSILISPFMPEASQKIDQQLGVRAGSFKDIGFGKFRGSPKKGEHLFTKV